jgi:predicted nuclease of predicted toxin-antitoxin system
MKLIADEGVDQPIVGALRAAGFEVVYFAERAPGSPDRIVLTHAQDANALLLTCDKDFGELIFRNHLVTAGILLIRLPGLSMETKIKLVVDAVQEHGNEMLGKFAVIAPGLLRIRHSV